MKVIVFDLETSVDCPDEHGFRASPYYGPNKIVAGSYVILDDMEVEEENTVHHTQPTFPNFLEKLVSCVLTYDLVVGHNIQFDLAYLAKYNPEVYGPFVKIWDTKVVQHILAGHTGRWTLEEACSAHGVPYIKDEKIKKYWSSGYRTEDIPASELMTYVSSDARATMSLFVNQLEATHDSGYNQLITRRNASRLATAEMEHTGMRVDLDEMQLQKRVCTDKIKKLTEEFEDNAVLELMRRGMDENTVREMMPFNPASPNDVSAILWGGVKKIKMDMIQKDADGKDILYKTGPRKGTPKTKKTDIEITVPSSGLSIPDAKHKGTDDVVLKRVQAITTYGSFLPSVARTIQEIRKFSKTLGVYLDGMKKHVHADCKVHPSFHHHITRTGRLACSRPNLQNVTSSQVKKVFVPMPGKLFLEADFNQLELRCIAALSEDKQLVNDLLMNVDIHSAVARDLFEIPPTTVVTTEQRKMAKRGTFQLLYGAGAPAIAKQWEMPVAFAQEFVHKFFSRYPGIQEWRDKTCDRVKSRFTKDGIVVSTFGTPYHYDLDDWSHTGGCAAEVKYTQMINYPVQGLAAEIVHIMLGKIYKRLHHYTWTRRAKLVNCVHDSFLFEVDVKTRSLEPLVSELKTLTRALPSVIHTELGISMPIGLPMEVRIGLNWHHMQEHEEE